MPNEIIPTVETRLWDVKNTISLGLIFTTAMARVDHIAMEPTDQAAAFLRLSAVFHEAQQAVNALEAVMPHATLLLDAPEVG